MEPEGPPTHTHTHTHAHSHTHSTEHTRTATPTRALHSPRHREPNPLHVFAVRVASSLLTCARTLSLRARAPLLSLSPPTHTHTTHRPPRHTAIILMHKRMTLRRCVEIVSRLVGIHVSPLRTPPLTAARFLGSADSASAGRRCSARSGPRGTRAAARCRPPSAPLHRATRSRVAVVRHHHHAISFTVFARARALVPCTLACARACTGCHLSAVSGGVRRGEA